MPHFHVVFTLPSELRALAKFRPREIFSALLVAANDTLSALAETRLQARLGVTAVLHTWTRDLRFHPHVHAIVTAGGLALDRTRWIASSPKYLFPVCIMGSLLRGKMLAALSALHDRGTFVGFEDFDDPQGFGRFIARLARIPWVVYAKKPFRRADHVVAYLGRYTHRIAISNSRLSSVSTDAVTFRTKNGKTVSISPVEFLRRFVQHVLPDGLHKIRHYGLYASANADRALVTARTVLAAASLTATPTPSPLPASETELLACLTGRDVTRCPSCGFALERRPLLRPTSRAPPLAMAS